MDFVEGLSIIVAALAGGAGGSLFTIQHYKRMEQDRAAYEEDAAQRQDILAGLALLRRTGGTTRGTAGWD